MHLDSERIQRLLHGELRSFDEAEVRAHLTACASCGSDVARAEREEAWMLERLARLDHEPPRFTVKMLGLAPRRRRPGWGRIAAGIVFALAAAGAAYAAPGSPLPGAIRHAVEWLSVGWHSVRPAVRTPVSSATFPAGTPAAGTPAGIAVVPGASLIVAFDVGRVDTALVWLTDGAEVEVRSTGGAATFTSGRGRLSIEHRGPPVRFEVLIPRTAPLVEIRFGARQLFLKRKQTVIARSDPTRAGRYLLTQSSPER
ncbi:MAG: zf-HC2 domain-containing protein [Gemmatimonadales bacterium]|nr:zf-HC2 domain-containing protein [Gemmatimonadales bacterium]